MEGTNMLVLNGATMKLVLQHYLDHVLIKDNNLKVANVTYDAHDYTFKVTVAPKDEPNLKV